MRSSDWSSDVCSSDLSLPCASLHCASRLNLGVRPHQNKIRHWGCTSERSLLVMLPGFGSLRASMVPGKAGFAPTRSACDFRVVRCYLFGQAKVCKFTVGEASQFVQPAPASLLRSRDRTTTLLHSSH